LLPSAKIHKQTLNFTMSSHKAKSDIDAESDGNGKGSATDDVPTPMRALSKRFIELVKKPAWATDAKLFWPGAIILTRLYAHARASIKCSLADAVREFLTELNLVTATPFDKIDPDNVNCVNFLDLCLQGDSNPTSQRCSEFKSGLLVHSRPLLTPARSRLLLPPASPAPASSQQRASVSAPNDVAPALPRWYHSSFRRRRCSRRHFPP
jgi:hypothetical protein